MLEGLEISIVSLSKLRAESKSFRTEAEHYQHKYQELNRQLSANFVYLKDLVSKPISTGHTPSMKDPRFYGGDIKFIKTDNLRDNAIKEPFTNFLSLLGNEEIKRTALQEGDIITTIIGATHDVIARSCIVNKSLLPANINQNIALIRPDTNKINPEFLNIYLNSKYGKMYLEYLSRQMEQVNLNCEEVGLVKIPVFSDAFQIEIGKIVEDAHCMLKKSKSLYAKAENIILEQCGLGNWIPEITPYTKKKLSDFLFSGRLDAEYYQKKYDDLFSILKKCQCKLVHEFAIINNRGTQPKYVEDGSIHVINSKHILDDGIDYENLEKTDENSFIKSLRSQVKYGDVLTYTTGANIGRTQVYLSKSEAVASNHVNILRVEGINPIYLGVVMNSLIGRLQTERICTGTAQAELYPDDISNFIIPILSAQEQEKVADYVIQSYEAKKQSEGLLQIAKQRIENEMDKR